MRGLTAEASASAEDAVIEQELAALAVVADLEAKAWIIPPPRFLRQWSSTASWGSWRR